MNKYEAEVAEVPISNSPPVLPTSPQPPHPKCANYHRRDPNEGLVVTYCITFVNKTVTKSKILNSIMFFGSRINAVTCIFCKNMMLI